VASEVPISVGIRMDRRYPLQTLFNRGARSTETARGRRGDSPSGVRGATLGAAVGRRRVGRGAGVRVIGGGLRRDRVGALVECLIRFRVVGVEGLRELLQLTVHRPDQ